jgi:hypothetical protein
MGMAAAGAALALVAGCGQIFPGSSSSHSQPTETATTETLRSTAGGHAESPAKLAEGEHAHQAGAHGGTIVSIGLDSYHAEAIVEKGGRLRLLMLGKDESRIQEVDEQTLIAYVKAVGDAEAVPIELAAVPQEGDAAGQTSQFLGQLPESVTAREIEVTIPMLRIAGERFRVGFTTATPAHKAAMPEALPAADEQSLYLTPAGLYTANDIAANGNVTAAQKFRGVMAAHDMKPKVGDRICPITNTKANPKFTWVVDGKPYEFCCPPCVDEFVKLAKEQPDAIKPPETYIK